MSAWRSRLAVIDRTSEHTIFLSLLLLGLLINSTACGPGSSAGDLHCSTSEDCGPSGRCLSRECVTLCDDGVCPIPRVTCSTVEDTLVCNPACSQIDCFHL